jgi:hypothetical protein
MAVTPLAQALFSALIDYAGVFPPANQAVTTALAHYRSYAQHPLHVALSRFLLTADHLVQISDAQPPPLPVTLVTRAPQSDLHRVLSHQAHHPEVAVIQSVEVLLERSETLGVTVKVAPHFAALEPLLVHLASLPHPCTVFYEIPAPSPYTVAHTRRDEEVSNIVEQLAELNARYAPRAIGLKIRCGGADPRIVPSSEQLAMTIWKCGQVRVPLKFTAGLHTPFKPLPAAVTVDSTHGYLNVIFAAVLAYRAKNEPTELAHIISQTGSDPGAELPTWTHDTLTWCGHTVSADEIRTTRALFGLSFGSCSFLEPITQAVHLGYIS